MQQRDLIDVYQIVRLLSRHRSSVVKAADEPGSGFMLTGTWMLKIGSALKAHKLSPQRGADHLRLL